MLCPICEEGVLRIYEYGEQSYNVYPDGRFESDDFAYDEGGELWVECRDCEASSNGYNGQQYNLLMITNINWDDMKIDVKKKEVA